MAEQTQDLFDTTYKSAVISPCDCYRYLLTRAWGEGDKVGFIMLNPSTADHNQDDPTIRRCIGFSKSWGFSGLEVCNLFAWRSTDPKQLDKVSDPIGPENDQHLQDFASRVSLIVAAWGNFPTARARAVAVLDLLRGTKIHAFGLNNNLSPKHPLYAPGNSTLFQINHDHFYRGFNHG